MQVFLIDKNRHDRSDVRNDSAEILSVSVPNINKYWIFYFKSVNMYFAGTYYKSARSGTEIY